VFLLLFALLLSTANLDLERPLPLAPLFAVFATVICWLWGLMLAGVWFHPIHGTARIGSPWFLGAPRVAQVLFRWYAALFLTLLFVGFPAFVLAHLVAGRAAA
jgi:hypothetical protein